MKAAILAIFVFLAITLSVSATVYFEETFSDGWENRWVKSKAAEDYGTLKLATGEFFGDAEDSKGAQTSQDARFYEYTTKLTPFSNEGKTLVFQFTVKHDQVGFDCGGGYIKLLPAVDQEKFNGDAKYYIMFGPDICGPNKRIHLIFNYNGENLLWKKSPAPETDRLTHLYTLIVRPDNTYEVLVDNKQKESGKLVEDWDFLPAKEIADPNAKKPADWVDAKEIPDVNDVKPADWVVGEATIADPKAVKPADWDEEEDGVWEAPRIPNPEFKGEWKQKTVPNPAYKGEWSAPMIPNPAYKPDENLYRFTDISTVGIDLWQVKSGTVFDNIIVTDSVEEAKAFDDKHNHRAAEKAASDAAEEKKRKEAEEAAKKHEAERKAAETQDEDDEEAAPKPVVPETKSAETQDNRDEL